MSDRSEIEYEEGWEAGRKGEACCDYVADGYCTCTDAYLLGLSHGKRSLSAVGL